jgi:hypothetical protein
LFYLLQSLEDTRASSELQTLICEADDGYELWLFSFCFPALFVCLFQSIGGVSSEFQTIIFEIDDGKELWFFSFNFPALFVYYKTWGTLRQVQSFKP